MTKFNAMLAVAVLLSACGGGSDAPHSVATATVLPPAQASTPTNPNSAPLAPMPVPTAAVKITSGSVNQGGNAQEWDIGFVAAVNLTVSGQLNKIWVSAAAAGGNTTIGGSLNTIVFRPGTQTAVTVSGSGNTFYLAEGSPIKIEGTGAAASTVKYYKP